MKLGLTNSVWLGTAIDPAQEIQLTKEIGFDTIDIFADPLELTPQELRTTRETCERCCLPMVSTVCCALRMADCNSFVRKFYMDRVKRYLDLAYDLPGKNLLLVVGQYIWNQEVIAPIDQWRFAVDGVAEPARHAQSPSLKIAVERAFLSRQQPGASIYFTPELLSSDIYCAWKFQGVEESDRWAEFLLVKQMAECCFSCASLS